MKKNNGAISIFALVSMLFFLIFIMVVYNNLSTKGQTQVETTGVLVDLYGSEETASSAFSSRINGGSTENVSPLYVKSSSEKSKMNTLVTNESIYLNGKVYKK